MFRFNGVGMGKGVQGMKQEHSYYLCHKNKVIGVWDVNTISPPNIRITHFITTDEDYELFRVDIKKLKLKVGNRWHK